MITLGPTALVQVADAAEVLGGCAPGVAWGRAHVWQDIEPDMQSDWAFWVLDNMLDQLSDPLSWTFVRACAREPVWAAQAWHEIVGLTDLQYVALAVAAAQYFTRWSEHTQGRLPGWRHAQ